MSTPAHPFGTVRCACAVAGTSSATAATISATPPRRMPGLYVDPPGPGPNCPSKRGGGTRMMDGMTVTTASTQITDEVTAWPGVEAGPGKRGEFAFKVGRREIGHLHGDRSAHFFFPKDVWAQLREEGRIVPHPVFPDKAGPAARSIESDEDV